MRKFEKKLITLILKNIKAFNNMRRILFFLLIFILSKCSNQIYPYKDNLFETDLLYRYSDNTPRWISFENKTGTKGQGGKENYGAKGHAFDRINKSETLAVTVGEGKPNSLTICLRVYVLPFFICA